MKAYLYFGAAALAVSAASPAVAIPKTFQAQADKILADSYKADAPGAAVIVTEGGKTVYAKGRGLADINAKTPITPDTVFRLGSITKQFSAAVVMQLVEEGKVSLDDPLSKYLPDYPQPGASATVRQLLSHTSGVQSYTGIPGFMVEENISQPMTTEQLIAVFKDKPSPSKPGEKWAYNNSGYALIGAIIEKATGKAWHEAINERIAAPLKLSSIAFGEARPARMAVGYTGSETGQKPAMKIHMNVPHAAGGLIGTVGDLAAWANALHHGKVVSAGSYAAMTTPTKTIDGKEHPYGFGLGFREIRGRRAIEPSGGIPGFNTDSVYLPEKDVFVAVFSNSDDPETNPGITAQRLAAAAIGDPHRAFTEVRPDLKALEPVFGVYMIEGEDGERRFFARDGQLFTQRTGLNEQKAYAAGSNLFFYGGDSLNWFELKTGKAGSVTMEMHQDGEDKAEIAVRTGPIPPEAPAFQVPAATLQSYAGTYKAGRMVATVEIDPEGQLKMRLNGPTFFPLRATSATEFRPRGIEARVVFSADGKSLTLYQGERSMEFQRS